MVSFPHDKIFSNYMGKYCPPGVICVENITLVVIIILAFVVGFVIYLQYGKPKLNKIIIQNTYANESVHEDSPGYGHRNNYIGLPINIKTQGRNTSYTQSGLLTRINGPETLLPLMSNPVIAGRDTYNYYTVSDQNNSIKLPISVNGKSCTGEHGCGGLSNGDTVYVEGYNDAFKVTMYENNTMQYIPYI